ncbi:MAG: ABC transporter permease [Lachnospiraceae bacterium]
MKNNILTIIKKEFARFFGDKRMVFTTILMPGLLIYVMYSFMGNAMMKEFQTDDDYVAKAYVENMPDELDAMWSELSMDITKINASEETDILQKVEEKEADILVVFPENFSGDVAEYEVTSGKKAPEVKVYYNSTASESSKFYAIVTEVLNAYESSMANKFDVNMSEDDYDRASEKDVTGQVFSMMLPMLLMIFMFSGCMSIAPEAIAGEKERGTIATLLVTPMKRSALALGKIISLSIISLLAGLSSFIGTMLSLPNLVGGEESGMNAGVYGVTDYVMLLGLILTTVLVLVSLISIISAFAKSIKEAGTAISPLMILVMGVSLVPMFGGDAPKNIVSFFVPILNSVQCFHGIFSFKYEMVQVVITIVMNMVYAGVFTFLLTKLFNSEKVMFSK